MSNDDTDTTGDDSTDSWFTTDADAETDSDAEPESEAESESASVFSEGGGDTHTESETPVTPGTGESQSTRDSPGGEFTIGGGSNNAGNDGTAISGSESRYNHNPSSGSNRDSTSGPRTRFPGDPSVRSGRPVGMLLILAVAFTWEAWTAFKGSLNGVVYTFELHNQGFPNAAFVPPTSNPVAGIGFTLHGVGGVLLAVAVIGLLLKRHWGVTVTVTAVTAYVLGAVALLPFHENPALFILLFPIRLLPIGIGTIAVLELRSYWVSEQHANRYRHAISILFKHPARALTLLYR
jgi:hypothetical protein